MEEFAAMAEPPEKDDNELTPEPPGPAESWPVAFMPDGEDICGNGCVLKTMVEPGIEELGKPPVPGARCKVKYAAFTLDGREWDASECLGLRLGMLYVNRLLEAAASSMHWGERATFVCTEVYAKQNNATRATMPEDACFRYDVTLLSWRAPQLRDVKSKYDAKSDELMAEVVSLKQQAAPLVRLGLYQVAGEVYHDCVEYLENPDKREDEFIAPAGREEEAQVRRVSPSLPVAHCLLTRC